MTRAVAEVAVIGGTGFGELLDHPEDHPEDHRVQTPYGAPSAGAGPHPVRGQPRRLRGLLLRAVGSLPGSDEVRQLQQLCGGDHADL